MDNDGEYKGYLIPMLENKGMKHETTAPFSSSSNGNTERLNRTLNEHIRCMLFQADMPILGRRNGSRSLSHQQTTELVN